MAPDLGCFAGQCQLATYAHTFAGSLVICAPPGLLLFCAFYLLRKPLALLSPQPHRAALTPLANRHFHHSWRSRISIATSTLLGAGTHCVWDSFTRANGWAVQRVGFLRAPLFTIGDGAFTTFYILQQVSTFFGVAVLVCAYVTWLRRSEARAAPLTTGGSEQADLPDSTR